MLVNKLPRKKSLFSSASLKGILLIYSYKSSRKFLLPNCSKTNLGMKFHKDEKFSKNCFNHLILKTLFMQEKS